jgi:hypothetical protein
MMSDGAHRYAVAIEPGIVSCPLPVLHCCSAFQKQRLMAPVAGEIAHFRRIGLQIIEFFGRSADIVLQRPLADADRLVVADALPGQRTL